MGLILTHWFLKVFERILQWDYCSSSLYWMCYTSTEHLLKGWKNHYSYQGLDMFLFCTAIGKIPSHCFLEEDILVHELLGKSSRAWFFLVCVCFGFIWFFFWVFFPLIAEFFQQGEESLPGDLLPLPHLATHEISGSFGVSPHCCNKTAVSQAVLVVLVLAGSHQRSLLSCAKPHDADTCQPCCWRVPLPTGSGIHGSSGWSVSRGPKVCRGSRTQSSSTVRAPHNVQGNGCCDPSLLLQHLIPLRKGRIRMGRGSLSCRPGSESLLVP